MTTLQKIRLITETMEREIRPEAQARRGESS